MSSHRCSGAVVVVSVLVFYSLVFTVFGENGTSLCSSDNANGETNQWRHIGSNLKNLVCVVCLCEKDGQVNCSSRECSTDFCRSGEHYDDECCRLCTDSRVVSTSRPAAQLQVACFDKGQIFKDGETFASNSTSLQPRKPNQCVQCVCQKGKILCRLKTCSMQSCQNPNYRSDDCCPVCAAKVSPAHQDVRVDNILVTFRTSGGGSVCSSGGISYPHGFTWHPVIGPLGQMDCVLCKCQMGKVECGRIGCSLRGLTCAKPQKVIGRCCPICVNKDSPSVLEDAATHPSVSISGRSQSEKLCLSKRQDYVVYKSHAFSTTSGYYQFAFQKVGDGGNTRLFSWTMKEGTMGDFSEQHLSKSDFSDVRNTFKFKLMGSTKSKLVGRFAKRSKKLAERCNKRCDQKVSRLESGLRLKKVVLNSQCLASDITFEI
ncbi:chordin-like protein 1 [Limulus polyphemus]|uniref:Chordin-like protein 1 n=1 Tax=Limulus polyphemus TaxID=6850 RepID=A0ABM1SZ36_LIMPO|nr:chordin-like protein 1 [Limulus polyphemus]XP_022248896.1 chordin-like protein 1 [Limulus polyphemus]